MNEYSITLFEACELLNRSKKTLSRYVRQGRLTPQRITSQQGTLEYRFSKADLEALRVALDQEAQATADRTEGTDQTGQTGHGRQDIDQPLEAENLAKPNKILEISPKTEETGQGRRDETGHDRADGTGQNEPKQDIISLLKETTELLKDQLSIKDAQIGTLNEQVHKLIERDRETNILLKGLQDKLMLLDYDPKAQRPIDTAGKARQDGTGQASRRERIRQITLFALLCLSALAYFIFNILPQLPTK